LRQNNRAAKKVTMYGPTTAAGAYAYRGGLVFATVIMPIMLLCEYGSMLGSSFAGEVLMTSLTYWTWIVTISFPIVPYLFMVLGVALGRVGVATGGIILYAIAVAWQLWAIVLGMLLFADCEWEIHCADNLSYIGAIIGPYGGPSIRFLFIFISLIAMVIAEIVAIGVLFSARRTMLIVQNAATYAYAGSLTSRGMLMKREKAYGLDAILDTAISRDYLDQRTVDDPATARAIREVTSGTASGRKPKASAASATTQSAEYDAVDTESVESVFDVFGKRL
jgi:hypothetical protein